MKNRPGRDLDSGVKMEGIIISARSKSRKNWDDDEWLQKRAIKIQINTKFNLFCPKNYLNQSKNFKG